MRDSVRVQETHRNGGVKRQKGRELKTQKRCKDREMKRRRGERKLGRGTQRYTGTEANPPLSPDTLAYTEDRVAVIVRKGQRRRDL